MSWLVNRPLSCCNSIYKGSLFSSPEWYKWKGYCLNYAMCLRSHYLPLQIPFASDQITIFCSTFSNSCLIFSIPKYTLTIDHEGDIVFMGKKKKLNTESPGYYALTIKIEAQVVNRKLSYGWAKTRIHGRVTTLKTCTHKNELCLTLFWWCKNVIPEDSWMNRRAWASWHWYDFVPGIYQIAQ